MKQTSACEFGYESFLARWIVYPVLVVPSAGRIWAVHGSHSDAVDLLALAVQMKSQSCWQMDFLSLIWADETLNQQNQHLRATSLQKAASSRTTPLSFSVRSSAFGKQWLSIKIAQRSKPSTEGAKQIEHKMRLHCFLHLFFSFSFQTYLFLLTQPHCCLRCVFCLVCCISNLKLCVSRSLPCGNCSTTQSSSDVIHHCK